MAQWETVDLVYLRGFDWQFNQPRNRMDFTVQQHLYYNVADNQRNQTKKRSCNNRSYIFAFVFFLVNLSDSCDHHELLRCRTCLGGFIRLLLFHYRLHLIFLRDILLTLLYRLALNTFYFLFLLLLSLFFNCLCMRVVLLLIKWAFHLLTLHDNIFTVVDYIHFFSVWLIMDMFLLNLN